MAGGHGVNNVESVLFEDGCIVISQIAANVVLFFLKRHKKCLDIFQFFTLNPSRDPSIGWGSRFHKFRIFTIFTSFGVNIGMSGAVVL